MKKLIIYYVAALVCSIIFNQFVPTLNLGYTIIVWMIVASVVYWVLKQGEQKRQDIIVLIQGEDEQFLEGIAQELREARVELIAELGTSFSVLRGNWGFCKERLKAYRGREVLLLMDKVTYEDPRIRITRDIVPNLVKAYEKSPSKVLSQFKTIVRDYVASK